MSRYPRWLRAWLTGLLILLTSLPAAAQQAWQAFDSNYPGVTLACGKPFHYVLAPPVGYNAATKWPLYVWLHSDHSGDGWYLGDGNTFKQANIEAASFNTAAFQARHPAFIAAPSADQTNGNGSTGSCSGSADSAVKNWGGWFHTGSVAGSGTVYSGDTGPNTFAVIAMIKDLQSRYSIDPAKIMVNGHSLGGHASQYLCYHYNAYTGDKGRVFSACAGTAGTNQADTPMSAAKAATMIDVPQWMFSGVNDTASPAGPWNSALCSALGGNPASLTAITSATANRCGSSQMRYTLAPGVGHSETDASGNPVYSNQIINDFMFAQSAPVAQPTGRFHVSGGKIIAPDGSNYKPVGINVGDFRANLDMASAVTNFATGAPMTALFPGINFVRVALYGGGSAASPTAYPAASSYDAFVNSMTALHIVIEFEHHIGTTGSSAGGGQGVVPAPGSAWLNAENAAYAALATRYKDNPYVWFGTNNEPPSVSGLSEWQKSNYDAIRNTGNQNPIMLEVWGSRPPGYGGTPLQQGMVQSIYSQMTNVIWDPHVYPFINGNNTLQASNDQTAKDMGTAAQAITSADGVVPVIIGEFGPSTTGSSIEANATQNVTGVLNSGYGSAVWHWGLQDCCNNLNSGSTLTALGVQIAAAIRANAQTQPTEILTVNTIAPVQQNTPFVVTGTISGATGTPSLQYSNNGGGWSALPAGAVVTSTGFTFTNPGLGPSGAATVSVRDANNNAVSATGPPFVVKAPESANNTVAVPSSAPNTPTFSDTFTSLPLHNVWQAGDKWQLVAPDTPAGRGGPNFVENGHQWWVNPFNPNTPISGIYTQDSAGLHLGLIGTPAPQQAYINAQAGAAMPYVGGLMNTSQTNYQKYGYWEFKVAVPKVNGFTFQADTENVQVTGQFPPEIDLRIGTNASGVQTVLFEFALGGGQYTQYVVPGGFDATAMHTYGWDWEPDFITFYVDNVQMFQAANPSAAYKSNPMFLFLVTAANYVGNTGDPALGSLPVNATVQAVNVYSSRPGGANGPSATIIDAVGNAFFITSGGQISINGVVDGTTANAIELAYVNHVLWHENVAGNWYSYNGSPGSYTGPTTVSPLIGVVEAIAVSPISNQTSNAGFAVSGTITGATVVPTLEYQDNTGIWQPLPGTPVVSTTGFSFSHPAVPAGQYSVAVRDAGATSILGRSNTFTVAQAAGEALSVNPIGTQNAGVNFAVSGSITGANGTPTLEYQDGAGGWNPLPGGAVVTGTTFTFTHPAMLATSSGVVSVRDANATSIFGSSNIFAVNAAPVETLTISPIASQHAAVGFTVAGTIANVSAAPSLQYQDNGGAWQALPAGSSVSTTAFSFAHPGMAALASATVAVRDAAAIAISAQSNTFAVLLPESANNTVITTVGPVIVDANGTQFALTSGGRISINGAIDITTANVTVLAYVSHVSWQENAAGNWYSYVAGVWTGPTTVSPLPPETLAVGSIGTQVVGVAFSVSGTIGNALVAPALQYSVSNGPWTAFPAGGQVTSTAFNFVVPGIASAGTATVSVRDAASNTIVGSSNTFTVSAAPLEQLAIASIANQSQNVAFRVTGTILNATTIPTLEYNVNGGAWNPLPSGSPVSLVTQASFAFTVPGIASAGPTTIGVRDAGAPSISVVSNTFMVGSVVGESLAVNQVLGQLAGQGFLVTGTIANATGIPTLEYTVNNGTWSALPSGSSVSAVGFSVAVPGQVAGTATVSVRDATTPSIVATSNSFTIAPVGNEALAVNPIGQQPVGTPFSVSGSIVNQTSPPSLQYSDNGGLFQPLPAGSTITATNFSFIHPGLGASQSMTVVIRDANHPAVLAAAPPFMVLARESANLTTITTVGPQIVDSAGNAYTLTAGAQVARNGIPDPATSGVIEIAYVNRQVWYENANLQWWSLSTIGTWGPTGGTLLGPLPSSKANIYQTRTAKLATVPGFTIAVPGIVINDTVVGGSFSLAITATNGTLTMPGATGSGSASLSQVATLSAINQSLAGLQYTGRTIGNGVISIKVTDPAQSVATTAINVTVVRAAPTIPPGK